MKLIADLRKCRHTATKSILVGVALAIAQIAPLAAADPAEKFDAIREFSEVYEQLKSRYVEGLDDKKLVASAIKGMLSTLDPFSDYLEPEAYAELRQETGGVFGGLGMEVALVKGGVKIISALEDSPASRAGLQVGDLITQLGETRVEGLTLEQAIQHARGAPDTSIALTVLSIGDAKPRVVTVKRAIIQARSVKAAVMDNGVFYLKITHFHKQTAENMLAALTAAYQQSGELRGVVLDLRDNPGGVLKSAVAVSSAFLPEDSLVVYTDSASEQSRMRLVTKPLVPAGAGQVPEGLRAALQEVPVIALVNGGSASAAEIVAGALQSYGRATILGTKTFGKGSVQVLAPLSSGAALKVTTAYYHVPDGRRIQGVGVVPDIAVEQSPIQESASTEPSATKTAERVRVPSIIPEGDYQFERALEFLRSLPILVQS
jgi:carboxyl-terminal processing protease